MFDLNKLKLNEDGLPEDTEVMCEALAEMYFAVLKSTVLVTCLAHERGNDLNSVRVDVMKAAAKYLVTYGDEYQENPLNHVELFFHRVVLMVRDATEEALGVGRKVESDS